ncbi:MAG: EAL domain-containing protein [Ruminococcus sp.]|nr:EAL domain-containing protein [Ruminococcus sp.]
MEKINFTDMGLGLSLSAFLVALTDLVFSLVSKRYDKPQNKVYLIQLGILKLNAVCGMVTTFTGQSKYTSDSAFAMLIVSRYIYFLTHALIPPVFFFYISNVTGRNFRRRGGGKKMDFLTDRFLLIAVAVNELIIALNPLTNWIYVFNENRQFKRCWGEFIFVYGYSAVWMAAAFIMLMCSRKFLSNSRKSAIVFCYIVGLAGVLLQLIYSKFRIEVFMETLGYTGVLLFVENEDDRMDVTVGTYNAAAFKLDIAAAVSNGIQTRLILVRNITCDEHRIIGSAESDYAPERAVAEYLGKLVGKHYIYSIGRGKLAAVLYNKTDSEALELAESVADCFGKTWESEEIKMRLDGRVLLVDVPERASTAEEVLYIADCPMPVGADRSVMSGSDLDWIVRRSAVEAAVRRGLKDGSFDVWYQPTYTIDKQLHGAEALLRMNDRELGRVYPDEFIPVAEQLGLIGEIDEFVYREVCAFLASHEPQRFGVGCINVNLSVTECMKSGFAERFTEIADRWGIQGKEVVFEITESVAAEDIVRISAVIDKLKSRGFSFAIDDFGTGYSNLTATLSLGAELIKIDKSVLWTSCKDENGGELLSASVKMVRAMHKKSVAEGVETEEHIEKLAKLGCDYLQGYYFSKPLPKDEFLRFISK